MPIADLKPGRRPFVGQVRLRPFEPEGRAAHAQAARP